MSASQPLQGTELIDCAKANAAQGVSTAARLCGYGQDTATFEQELLKACHHIGVSAGSLKDLITDQQMVQKYEGIEIAPDTNSEL